MYRLIHIWHGIWQQACLGSEHILLSLDDATLLVEYAEYLQTKGHPYYLGIIEG